MLCKCSGSIHHHTLLNKAANNCSLKKTCTISKNLARSPSWSSTTLVFHNYFLIANLPRLLPKKNFRAVCGS